MGPTGLTCSTFCQLGIVEKREGNLVFDLKHFWDALQTFYTFWGDFGGCLGRLSVGTTVDENDVLRQNIHDNRQHVENKPTANRIQHRLANSGTLRNVYFDIYR